MNIAVVGYLGFGNFGDELFLQTYRQLFPGDDLHAWSADENVAAIDRVIIGGGDLIIPHRFHSAYFPQQLRSKPTVVSGVGVVVNVPAASWPAAEVEKHRRALASVRAVFTRDPLSAQVLKDHRLFPTPVLVPDVGFAYREPRFKLDPASHLPTCGLVVANYGSLNRTLVKGMAQLLLQKGWHVLLIPVVEHPTNPYADRKLCLELAGDIEREKRGAAISVTPQTYDLEHVYRRLQTVDLVISFKMHPSLVALRGGVPVLCFSNSHKKKYLMSLFELDDFVLPLKADPAIAKIKLETLVDRHKQLHNPIKARAMALEREASAAAKHLVELVRA